MKEIFMEYQEKFEILRGRRVKELTVKMENKEQKDRRERDKVIKGKVYACGGIEELKRDI